MKRKMWMRALALLTATAAVMTDSGMVYAAQTVENVPLQQESAEKEVPEEETPLETEPVSEEPEGDNTGYGAGRSGDRSASGAG